MSTRTRGGPRIESIDVMRGIAALGVFVFHVAVFSGFPKRTLPAFQMWGRTYDAIPSFLALGASGVNLFFVISGFCLALQRLKSPTLTMSNEEVRVYALSRAARIVPAYWLTIALALPFAAHRPFLDLIADALTHAVFAHGFRPETLLSLHGGLWSMATEVQFYVVFPSLLIAWTRLGSRRFVVVACALTLVFRFIVAQVPEANGAGEVSWKVLLSYSLPGRLSEFVMGMWLAEAYVQRDNAWVSRLRWLWVAALIPALWARGWGPYWLPDILLGALYCAILGALVTRSSRLPGHFVRIAAEFGRSSYSFFLIHYLVLAGARLLKPAGCEGPYASALYFTAVALPASIAAGFALYRAVELPLWKWGMARMTRVAVSSPTPS